MIHSSSGERYDKGINEECSDEKLISDNMGSQRVLNNIWSNGKEYEKYAE